MSVSHMWKMLQGIQWRARNLGFGSSDWVQVLCTASKDTLIHYSYKKLFACAKQNKTGEKPYQCEVCPKAFAHKSDLNKHRLTHTGERPHSCEVCGKSFSQKSHLIDHLLTHTGEKPHSCESISESQLVSKASAILRSEKFSSMLFLPRYIHY
ncbi:hypothetical protein JTE90_012169 [Oedothorax gibbosus]|uniref:C2H2-type domain-containing protein n=1 Tax=Oedothorax gibbosus TaxID=931172 RepID=A0AAV6TUP2_9ARAC|nr:hypothetical protein JTE90_012169 [Oedothorax gibbosus]